MANPSFLAPKYNKIIDSDPQIQKVNLEFAEWGARKSNVDRSIVNEMEIVHETNAKGK